MASHYLDLSKKMLLTRNRIRNITGELIND